MANLEPELNPLQAILIAKAQDLERKEKLLDEIKEELKSTEDAGDFCLWLAEKLGLDTSKFYGE
jgi:hypothetical protein